MAKNTRITVFENTGADRFAVNSAVNTLKSMYRPFASLQVLTRTRPSFFFSCNNHSLFKIHSLNVIPSSPHSRHWRTVVRQDILSCPGKVRRTLLKANFPPPTAALQPPREVICNVWVAAMKGDRVRRRRRRRRVGGLKNERGLNQWHPLQPKRQERVKLPVALHGGACLHRLVSISTCLPSSLFLLRLLWSPINARRNQTHARIDSNENPD